RVSCFLRSSRPPPPSTLFPYTTLFRSHGLDNRWVGVPQGVDRDAGEQVEVLLTLAIPNVAALALDEVQRRGAVGVHQRVLPAVLPGGFRGGSGLLLSVAHRLDPSGCASEVSCCWVLVLVGLGGNHGADTALGHQLENHRVWDAPVDDVGGLHAVA